MIPDPRAVLGEHADRAQHGKGLIGAAAIRRRDVASRKEMAKQSDLDAEGRAHVPRGRGGAEILRGGDAKAGEVAVRRHLGVRNRMQ